MEEKEQKKREEEEVHVRPYLLTACIYICVEHSCIHLGEEAITNAACIRLGPHERTICCGFWKNSQLAIIGASSGMAKLG